jgi:NADPH2:quinone reductase
LRDRHFGLRIGARTRNKDRQLANETDHTGLLTGFCAMIRCAIIRRPFPPREITYMNLPAKMRAIEIAKPGGPEVLTPAERAVPQPKPHEILVKVAAAGVNRPDILQRMGLYAVPPDASDLPGLEIAGTVAAVGADVKMWKVGDAVCALTHGGGYAEYCVTPEVQALPVPKGLSMTEAASLPETCFTVYSNVFDRGALKAGEIFLVQGGSSGIGVTAIQIAAAMGHRVFATAGSDEKCAACVKLGAEKAFNYKTQDWAEELKKATDGKGVNVILDMVGGDYVPKELKSLAVDGRLVMIAFLRGMKAEVDLSVVMAKRLQITGSTLRPRTVEFKGQVAKSLRERVWPLVEAGRIKPVIYKTFPLAEASEAHKLMETSQHIGKIVLTV